MYVIRKEIMEYRLNSAVLMLTRYLIDDDYSKEFDEENNLKRQWFIKQATFSYLFKKKKQQLSIINSTISYCI